MRKGTPEQLMDELNKKIDELKGSPNSSSRVIVDDEERDLAQFVVEENLKCLGECSYKRNYDPSFDINALKKQLEQMI